MVVGVEVAGKGSGSRLHSNLTKQYPDPVDAPRPFLWTYDRCSAEEMLTRGYETFSVGIFQWIPKASRKGCKRSNTIRVQGYTAEPQRVFDKADQLCKRLNHEGIREDDSPAWLQKQYSVPKPTGYARERTSEGLTGAQVRSIRERVMKDELLPLGFIKGKAGTYVRQRNGQIHLIDFQASQWGGQFYVNLGFHYTFMPPLMHQRPVSLEQINLLDCMAKGRIEGFSEKNRTGSFKYGSDRDTLRDVFIRCASEAVLILDGYSDRWNDPAQMLPAIDSCDGKWHPISYPDFCRAAILLRLGHDREAREVFDRWRKSTKYPIDERLSRLVDKVLSRRLDWITH